MIITSNAGHSRSTVGAANRALGLAEWDIARRLNSGFIDVARSLGHTAIDSTSDAATVSTILSAQVRIANASRASLAISHHLNGATSESASGTCVLYHPSDPAAQAQAAKLSAAIAAHLGIRDRGPIARQDLYFLNRTTMRALLIEYAFLTNSDDARRVMARLDSLPRVVAEALGLGSPAATPAPSPSAPAAPAPAPAAKTISQLADEVIAGQHGSGDARRRSLGSQYSAVQAEVNRRLLGRAAPAPKRKTVSELATEVIAGKWGVGNTRKARLTGAGYDYRAVQAEVNRRLGAK